MRTACMADLIRIAKETDGPFSKSVREATEVGVVVPSILETKLKATGLSINYQPGTDHGEWVLITTTPATEFDPKLKGIVGRAFSHDRGDALLQAVYAELKVEANLLQLAKKMAGYETAGLIEEIKARKFSDKQQEHLQTLASCVDDKSALTHQVRQGIDGDPAIVAFLNQL